MIIYFADKSNKVIGQASTDLPNGMILNEDKKVSDIEVGAASFEGTILFDDDTRTLSKQCIVAGNYIFRSNWEDKTKGEYYQIVEVKRDAGAKECYFYAEDASTMLLNNVAIKWPDGRDETQAPAQTLTGYFNMFMAGTGFTIGTNEATSDQTMKKPSELSSADSESTVLDRLRSIAADFGYEISCEYAIDDNHMAISGKYVNVYKKRGNDSMITLALNREVDRIEKHESIENLATALLCYGGSDADGNTVTLEGYSYSSPDNDYVVAQESFSGRNIPGYCLESPSAIAQWGKLIKVFEDSGCGTKESLAIQAAKALNEVCHSDVTYEVEVARLPDEIGIGDYVNAVDEEDGFFLKTRVLKLEESITGKERKATLGDKPVMANDSIKRLEGDLDAANAALKAAKKKIYDLEVGSDRIEEIVATAQAAAESAQADATAAKADAAAAASAASQAQTSAESALSSARSATQSANGALKGLSTVQDVIGVLDWAKDNATYTLTSDTDIVPGKTYWTRSGAGSESDPYTYTPVVNPVKADLGTYYEISGVDEAMADYINTHLALTDEGLYIMADGSAWKVQISDDGVYILDPTGDPANQMTANGSIIGYVSDTHLEIDQDSLDIISNDGAVVGTFSDNGVSFGRWKGYGDSKIDFSSDGFIFKWASGGSSSYITSETILAEMVMYEKGSSYYTFGIRKNNSAKGNWSFAEGRLTTASGDSSHAEGWNTIASSESSHAEGVNTIASGESSHAEGYASVASGDYSHAQNIGTIAGAHFQTVIGKYNDNSRSYNAFEIGNGTSDSNRSNAFAVGWNGNIKFAGKATGNNGTRDIELNITEATIAKYVALGMSTS